MPNALTIQQINDRLPEKSRFTVISFAETRYTNGKGNKFVYCKCACGIIKQVSIKAVLTTTLSCGCYNMELISALGNNKKYDRIEKLLSLNLPDNRLTPISFSIIKTQPCGDEIQYIKCVCLCGQTVEISLYHFTNNQIKSCGCLRDDMCRDAFTKYIGNIKGIRSSYDAMIARCYSKTSSGYKYYGGIGVVVCDLWLNDYQSFLDWAKSNGWEEGLELDKDKIGNGYLYSPETCCWLTHTENIKYRKDTTVLDYMGEGRTLHEIGKMVGRKGDTLKRSMNKGLSLEQAINKPNYKRIK